MAEPGVVIGRPHDGGLELSIVIPTRNRAGDLRRSLEALGLAIRSSRFRESVELCCVNNWSSDDTEAVGAEFASRYDFMHHFRPSEPQGTPEESLLKAVGFARGRYVWVMGDDDALTAGALDRLMQVLRAGRYGLVLQSAAAALPGRLDCYLDARIPAVEFASGADLFRSFGFFHATTTFSCLCFERRPFLAVDWPGLFSCCPLYSHVYGLLIAFSSSPCLYLTIPAVLYTKRYSADEFTALNRHLGDRGFPAHFGWTLGPVRLARRAAEAGIDISVFHDAVEQTYDIEQASAGETLFTAFVMKNLIHHARYLIETPGERRFSAKEVGEFGRFFTADSPPDMRELWSKFDRLYGEVPAATGEAGVRQRLFSSFGDLYNPTEAMAASRLRRRPRSSATLLLGGFWRAFPVRGAAVDLDGHPSRRWSVLPHHLRMFGPRVFLIQLARAWYRRLRPFIRPRYFLRRIRESASRLVNPGATPPAIRSP